MSEFFPAFSKKPHSSQRFHALVDGKPVAATAVLGFGDDQAIGKIRRRALEICQRIAYDER